MQTVLRRSLHFALMLIARSAPTPGASRSAPTSGAGEDCSSLCEVGTSSSADRRSSKITTCGWYSLGSTTCVCVDDGWGVGLGVAYGVGRHGSPASHGDRPAHVVASCPVRDERFHCEIFTFNAGQLGGRGWGRGCGLLLSLGCKTCNGTLRMMCAMAG